MTLNSGPKTKPMPTPKTARPGTSDQAEVARPPWATVKPTTARPATTVSVPACSTLRPNFATSGNDPPAPTATPSDIGTKARPAWLGV